LKTKDDIENDFLFGVGAAIIAQSSGWDTTAPARKRDKKYEHDEVSYNHTLEYPENTYSLFAILVHRGTAYTGHYFAYINDGENWYEFNDSKVYKVEKP
jgi:ubiquitin C-terminal hydrolase